MSLPGAFADDGDGPEEAGWQEGRIGFVGLPGGEGVFGGGVRLEVADQPVHPGVDYFYGELIDAGFQGGNLDLHNWNNTDNSPDYLQFAFTYNYGSSNNNGNLLSSYEQNSPTTQDKPGTQLSPAVNRSYTYDGVNRLTNVTDSSYSRTMCYDAYGNGWVTAWTGSADGLPGNAPQEIGGSCPAGSGATPYSSNNKNQLTGVSYDTVGNEISFRGNTVKYDAENRVVSVVNGSTTLVSYQYDGDGHRIQKTTPSGTTNYVYDASGRLMAEYAGSTAANAALSKEYVRLTTGFVSANTDLVAIENASGNGSPCGTCYVISDDLGSIRFVGDINGNAMGRHDFLPFGEEAGADANRPTGAAFFGADKSTQRFTGKERDTESGLDYFGARFYGSALGRFTSPDWSSAQQPVPYANLANPQTLNLYAYVSNNPLSRTDPDGHNWWDKLKNLFGWAGCWCEGEQAESAALRNLYAEQRRQQQELDQWRANMKNPGYHVAMAMVYATAGAGGEEIGAEVEAAATEEEGALSGANYAQRTFSRNFSSGGTFAGRSVEEIATELRSGQLNTADVPVEYIVRDGNKLILNTRSAQALEQAGIPRSQWVSVNVTGDAAAEARLTGQLQRNGLTSQGVSTVTPNQE